MNAIVLSGGGMKGAYEAGALLRIEEKGFKADAVYGTSTGAINSFGYAFGDAKRLVKYWGSIKNKSDLFDSIAYWKLLWRKGLATLEPLRKWMETYGDAAPRMMMCASYVDLCTGELSFFKATKAEHKADAIKYVLASGAQPPMVEPIEDNGRVLIDGGARDQAPLKAAIDDGHEVIRCVLTNPYPAKMEPWKYSFPPFLSLIFRSVDIVCNENLVNDIERCLAYNDIPGKKQIDLKYIGPSAPLYDSFEVDSDKIAKAIELGYRDAEKLF